MAESQHEEVAAAAVLPSFEFHPFSIKASDSNLDEKLFAYVSASVEASRHFRVMPVAMDKASLVGLCLHSSVLALPNGVVILCCPNVALCGPGVCAEGCSWCSRVRLRSLA